MPFVCVLFEYEMGMRSKRLPDIECREINYTQTHAHKSSGHIQWVKFSLFLSLYWEHGMERRSRRKKLRIISYNLWRGEEDKKNEEEILRESRSVDVEWKWEKI